MRISDEFPKLQEKTLIVAAGAQAGKVYILNDGRLADQETIEIPKVRYSDREGFFARLGRGRFFGSGAPKEERQDEKLEKEFLKELGGRLKMIGKKIDIDRVFLFAPQKNMKRVRESIPKGLQKVIREEFSGNYHKQHLSDLLKKIGEINEEHEAEVKRSTTMNDEARKIIENGEGAKNSIKKRIY